jgi:hypothetical protein
LTDLPPDLDEEPDIEPWPERMPRTGDRPMEYMPHEAISLTHEYVPQRDPYQPILNTIEHDDPYKDLGGLARPDAHFGAIEFDCPPEQFSGKYNVGGCGQPRGEKCKVWVERTQAWHTRKMPCVARIKLATEAGIL